MKFGIVKEPKIWLYGAMQSDTADDELLMGWAVEIKSFVNGWYGVVTHYGYEGFVDGTYIRLIEKDELEYRDYTGQMAVICRRFVDVLSEPRVQGRILATLSRGALVKILSDVENGYRLVEMADGRRGYIPCIAYAYRKDSDGYLYTENRKNYFKYQQKICMEEDIFRERVTAHAKSYLGTQYRWAGKSAEGLDCSGLTFMCYMFCGVLIYRDAVIKNAYPVQRIPFEKMKKGDLLYFPGHIAMYLGNGKYIHSTGNEKSSGCVVNSLLEEDMDFRKDLRESLYAVGSIWIS